MSLSRCRQDTIFFSTHSHILVTQSVTQSELQLAHGLRQLISVHRSGRLTTLGSGASTGCKLRSVCSTVSEIGTTLLRLKGEREWVIGFLLFLGQLPGNVVFGAQALAAFLQRGEVAGCHHAGALTRGSGSRQRTGDLGVGCVEEGRLVVGGGEGVGVGWKVAC